MNQTDKTALTLADFGTAELRVERAVAQIRAGGGVIVVSTDLEEIAAICGRALIFDRGRITAELVASEITVAGLIAHVGGAGEPAHV